MDERATMTNMAAEVGAFTGLVAPDAKTVEYLVAQRGMSREQVENIFEPFYTTKSQGQGLGMTYAKKVVEHHGGRISVDSRLNEGTRIKITLPLEEGPVE